MDLAWSIIAAPLSRFVSPGSEYHVFVLAGTVVTALAVYVGRRPGRPWRRIRAFFRAATAPAIWRHRSSWLDCKMFLFSSMFYATGITGLLGVSALSERGTAALLATLFGPPAVAGSSSLAATATMAVLYVVVYDLGYWACHYAMHKSPVLWEFHKVHHSAEVLTPLTEMRQHPVELMLFPVFNGLVIGALYAAVAHLFGWQAQHLSLFWTNVLMLAFIYTFLHLRHSQLWIPARGWLGRIVQSPAHHQIHHSTDPRHFDKNLGLCLSLWDWAFGTLYVPDRREALIFGLGAESREHDGLVSALWLPARKGFGQLLRRRPDGAAGLEGQDPAEASVKG
jgi:sterol desaturase/sphingolipid hydroxylase (fatty acid hydroxylase superfamily)